MSGAPARGTTPRRQRRHHHHHHHHHHQKHQRQVREERSSASSEEPEEKRPKVNPIFLWASQREQRIVEVRCEDYDKRNRIKLTKTAQGWRSIPRTASNMYSTGLAAVISQKANSANSSNSSDTGEEKESHATLHLRRSIATKELANGRTNGLVCRRGDVGRKRGYDEEIIGRKSKHRQQRDYGFPLDEMRNNAKVKVAWSYEGRRRVPCSDDDDDDGGEDDDEGNNEDNDEEEEEEEEQEEEEVEEEDEEEEEDDDDDEEEEDGDDDDDDEDEEAVNENEIKEGNKRFEKKEASSCNNGRLHYNLERLQKDKLFQPRVVLEQLRFSQLPEGVHQSGVLQTLRGKDEKGQNEDDVIAGEEKPDNEKRRQNANKAGIQDILNMIDATASPVLATDTPSADLPVDSTKTYEEEEVLNENHVVHGKSIESKIKDSNAAVLVELTRNKVKEHKESRTNVISSYQRIEDIVRTNNQDDCLADEKIEIHEEKILAVNYGVESEEERRKRKRRKKNNERKDDVVVVSVKNNGSESKSCKIAEADGGLGKRGSNSHSKWQSLMSVEDEEDVEEEEMDDNDDEDEEDDDAQLEAEDERPDEPGEPAKMIDYNDSSKILNALRNTPGLSVSITRTHTPESAKNVSLMRPASKASSSSSRSPDSQAECVERSSKNADSATESQGTTASPKNLPGLSIIIPSYRYRGSSQVIATGHSTSPSAKARVESPESTVNFPKNESYANGESKLGGRFPREEEDNEEREMEEEEDDCDSQVLEDLRRQKADSLAYDNPDRDYLLLRQGTGSSENGRKTPLENAKNQAHWISSSNRNSEAQAKCKYQDVEHFDEQVLEELRTRGTVVSPQPSGIPCSPASRRPSSAYLERLLPSPPCSVSCSEDAKNDLTLKGILSSPNQLEARDYEKQKEISNRCDQIPSDHLIIRADHSKDTERGNRKQGGGGSRNGLFQERLNVHGQEARNSGRPMSSGDIHSTYLVTDRVTPRRPMSAEWSVGRQKNQSSSYQKSSVKHRMHAAMEEVACATSTSTDKLLDPASQLRELIETSGHLIPDPLLVPRDYLPGLAAAPATEIPKLLASRPELRLPEALTRPDLLRDPDLLVISLAHLQHVLDHGEGPVSRSRQGTSLHPRFNNNNNGTNKAASHASNGAKNGAFQTRPKLSCKPIGTLMPAPIDLSSSRRTTAYLPLLRVRSGLLKQEPEVTSTASSPEESQLWHPLFGR
ncbi:hypothetical protein K0M31_013313 [Melipona bicolor]|uniref:Uncharacterized protein n=1 Tax=Melipona bicolor TaxID=60889 RepID=A0AA40FIG2_9HYME|nr:hypothetical protein K0M31_013313 [Melipona bicolor]